MMDWHDACAYAKKLGAQIDGGINWTWANAFPSDEKGLVFIAWLEANDFEHRGYYPGDPLSTNPNTVDNGVRFR